MQGAAFQPILTMFFVLEILLSDAACWDLCVNLDGMQQCRIGHATGVRTHVALAPHYIQAMDLPLMRFPYVPKDSWIFKLYYVPAMAWPPQQALRQSMPLPSSDLVYTRTCPVIAIKRRRMQPGRCCCRLACAANALYTALCAAEPVYAIGVTPRHDALYVCLARLCNRCTPVTGYARPLESHLCLPILGSMNA